MTNPVYTLVHVFSRCSRSLFSSVLWRLVRTLNSILPCFLGNERHDSGFLSSDLKRGRGGGKFSPMKIMLKHQMLQFL